VAQSALCRVPGDVTTVRLRVGVFVVAKFESRKVNLKTFGTFEPLPNFRSAANMSRLVFIQLFLFVLRFIFLPATLTSLFFLRRPLTNFSHAGINKLFTRRRQQIFTRTPPTNFTHAPPHPPTIFTWSRRKPLRRFQWLKVTRLARTSVNRS